ncbi:hypothetical protein ACWIGM_12735 [Bosea sp. NPDC055332]
MVKLFVVLGLALLAGGAYAIVDGWPYLVLERGFTEVILGALATIAGLILLALAAVLAEVRRLKGLVSGAMAVVALSESRAGEGPLPNAAPVRPEPALAKEPAREAGHLGIATTLAAGAGAAVVAGALTGLAQSEERPKEENPDKADVADKAEGGDGHHSEPAETAAEPSQSPPAVAEEPDSWLLPPASMALDAAPSDTEPDERSESDEADETAEGLQEKQERPASAGNDEVSQPDDAKGDATKGEDAKDEEAESSAASIEEPEATQQEDEVDAAKQETVPAPSSEDQLWWPKIERPARAEVASIDDEFNALRNQLAGVVNAPEVEPPRRDSDALASSESWMAPRPWPPVTQPRDLGVLGDADAEAAAKAAPDEVKTEPVPAENEPAVPELETEAEPQEKEAPEPASADAEVPPAEKVEPSAVGTKSDEEPAASDEGVIGAYQVGETQFTMFADGSIHARTPDGDYTFASMEELKAYLASEKDKLESSSN